MKQRSWIKSANEAGCHFPVQNLPYGVYSIDGSRHRCCAAIGDKIVDLFALESDGLLDAAEYQVFANETLNAFMALGPEAWNRVRSKLTSLLTEGGDDALRSNEALRRYALIPADRAQLHLPFDVAGYTDFYASRQHAFNVGAMFRGPENALPPNWLHIPIGYNGRSSTVVVSGTDVRRPLGQRKDPDSTEPTFGPSQRLDIELELGAVIGLPSTMGEPLTVAEADDLIFGYVILNDWSARDIQAWEYQPLGPFQSKAFATSISPWVVTKAALEPFRTTAPDREKPLLPYLREHKPLHYDISLEVKIRPEQSSKDVTISRTNYRHMYYSAAQQLTHHAIGGCKMRTGDLLGSGTISGPEKDGFGSLLEMSWGGKQPIDLGDGHMRSFVEDGDTLTLSGWAEGNGYRVGFGECVGKILPAPAERRW